MLREVWHYEPAERIVQDALVDSQTRQAVIDALASTGTFSDEFLSEQIELASVDAARARELVAFVATTLADEGPPAAELLALLS